MIPETVAVGLAKKMQDEFFYASDVKIMTKQNQVYVGNIQEIKFHDQYKGIDNDNQSQVFILEKIT